MLSEADLTLIVERASNLQERLAGEFTPRSGGEAAAKRRLARWKQLVGEEQPGRWSDVLRVSGGRKVSEPELLLLLGVVSRNPDARWPSWSQCLDELVNYLASSALASDKASPRRIGRGKGSVPFQQLLAPIGEYAWSLVAKRCPTNASTGKKARQELQSHLLRRLASVVAIPLHTAFLAYQAIDLDGLTNPVFSEQADLLRKRTTATEHFDKFVANYAQDGLRRFFLRYPVAARLVAELTMFWVEAVTEFLHRLEKDREVLGAAFNNGSPVGSLVTVKVGVSDPHDSGRTVLVATFGSGACVVYKPRPMAVDKAFFDLAKQLNSAGLHPSLRCLKVLDRGNYGWMEFARYAGCNSKAAARRYYQRAGALTCLVHWLQGTDFHRENVIASGEHPVLVDLEALAHPLRPEELPQHDGSSDLAWCLATSVLRTGLLPLWHPRSDETALYDYSGLDAPIRQKALWPSVRWKQLNSDEMSWSRVVAHRHLHAHRPRLKGQVLSIKNFASQVSAGYQGMSDLLLQMGQSPLLAAKAEVVDSSRRFIRRPTLLYGVVLDKSLLPACLVEGVDRSIELQMLPCEEDDESDRAVEIASLERLDIPYFKVHVGSSRHIIGKTEATTKFMLSEQASVVRLATRGRLVFSQGSIRLAAQHRRGKSLRAAR